jgi:hypothetical protein
MEALPDLADGLYFGLNEDFYHSLPMVSAHDIKELLISPLDYWENSALNPTPDEEDEEESFARTLGKAYHARILEGKDVYGDRFAPKFICPQGVLDKNDELKEACKKLGLAVGGKKQDLIDRLLAVDPTLQIKDVLEHDYMAEHTGKSFLDQKYLNRVERAAFMIEKHPQISKVFSGGYPEVTVIWTKDGIRRRARLDFLKPAIIADLKSFANKNGLPIKEAIIKAIRFDEHYIQAETYIEAGHFASQFAREGKIYQGRDLWAIDYTEPLSPQANFMRLLGEREEDLEFWWVFQQTGKAPVARTLLYNECVNMRAIAQHEIQEALNVYVEHRERHGINGEPWVDATPPERLSDEDFKYVPKF